CMFDWKIIRFYGPCSCSGSFFGQNPIPSCGSDEQRTTLSINSGQKYPHANTRQKPTAALIPGILILLVSRLPNYAATLFLVMIRDLAIDRLFLISERGKNGHGSILVPEREGTRIFYGFGACFFC